MTECKGDGSAFPEPAGVSGKGLTKREYFAAKALQGILADPNCRDVVGIAKGAVQAADALMAELNRKAGE